MIDLDYLEEAVYDGVSAVIADNTDCCLISDDDIHKAIQELAELVLDKMEEIEHEEEETDIELHGDMDDFVGEE